jgi:hypothetical protein
VLFGFAGRKGSSIGTTKRREFCQVGSATEHPCLHRAVVGLGAWSPPRHTPKKVRRSPIGSESDCEFAGSVAGAEHQAHTIVTRGA